MSDTGLGQRTPTELLDVMRDARRAERIATARRLLAAGRLCQLRVTGTDTDPRSFWCVDDWESVAAEIGAELGISRQRASWEMHYGTVLLERLPKLGAAFAAGDIDFRIIATITSRTALITDPDALARIDTQLAKMAPRWNQRADKKIIEYVDRMVIDLDPDAIRVARQADHNRHIGIEPAGDGMAEIYGTVHGPDAETLDRRLDELADTVCADDPRTKAQRRADALKPLAHRATTMACECGSEDCPAKATTDTEAAAARSNLVIHLIGDAAAIDGDDTDSPATAAPGYQPGYGTVPAPMIADLARNATIRPITHPKNAPPEPRYRPSQALADFVRARDLTCRFPSCSVPAWRCDIDHTVPYPLGPTHASNLSCKCRLHHLLKTFYTGPGGWNDLQLPDGTVIWTSPSGRIYTTKPQGALFFPQLAAPTGTLTIPTTKNAPTNPHRGLAMPTRRKTRAQDRTYRIHHERAINHARYAANPPPF